MDARTIEFLRLLGYLYLRNGQADRGVAALEAVRVFAPNDLQVIRSVAYGYLAMGRFADCLRVLDGAGAGHETWRELLRSRALWGLGRHDEARRRIGAIAGNLRGTDGP